jgi:tetratricopeptide (TPR) repeat protein
MRYLLILLILSPLQNLIYNYNLPIVKAENNQCDSLRNLAGNFYNSDKALSIKVFRKASDCYLENGYTADASFCFLNISTLYDEMGKQLENAILFANLSMAVNLDSMHQANINKYLGLLHGKNGAYYQSSMYFSNAIRLYKILKFEPGLHVTYFDIAQVRYLQKDYVTCQDYLTKSINFWETKNVQQRVFVNNILGIRLGIATDNVKSARQCISENEQMINQHTTLPQANLDTFYRCKYLFDEKFQGVRLD